MLVRLLFILRRRWPILVVVPILASLAGVAFRPSGRAAIATTYSSTAYINVDSTANPTSVQQALIDVKQGAVANAAAQELGTGDSGPEVAKSIGAKFDDKAYVVQLTATRETKEEAKKYADAFGKVFVNIGNTGQASSQAEQLKTYQDAINDAENDLQAFQTANRDFLRLPDPPPAIASQLTALQQAVQSARQAYNTARNTSGVGPTSIYRPVNVSTPVKVDVSKLQLPANLRLRVILAFIIGLIAAIGLVAFLEKLNPRIDDPGHAERLVGAPVLAMVPVIGRRRKSTIRRVNPEQFNGPFAEAYRGLRSHLDYRNAAEDRDTPARVMVVSATPAEGKTTTAAFLSLSYAETGRDPVVIGADMRRPTIHQMFEVPRVPGLSSRREGPGVSLNEIVRVDEVSGVNVVPSGPGTTRITGLLPELATITSVAQKSGRPVIVDTAPVMVANDSINFLPAVDWVVVVLRMGRSTERSVKQTITSLRLDGATVVGCVMVGSMEASDAKRYYYSYYADEDAPVHQRLRQRNRSARHDDAPAAAPNGAPVPVPAEEEETPASTPS